MDKITNSNLAEYSSGSMFTKTQSALVSSILPPERSFSNNS